jgi:hypothetical protein
VGGNFGEASGQFGVREKPNFFGRSTSKQHPPFGKGETAACGIGLKEERESDALRNTCDFTPVTRQPFG